jgi:hypothetical protein
MSKEPWGSRRSMMRSRKRPAPRAGEAGVPTRREPFNLIHTLHFLHFKFYAFSMGFRSYICPQQLQTRLSEHLHPLLCFPGAFPSRLRALLVHRPCAAMSFSSSTQGAEADEPFLSAASAVTEAICSGLMTPLFGRLPRMWPAFVQDSLYWNGADLIDFGRGCALSHYLGLFRNARTASFVSSACSKDTV